MSTVHLDAAESIFFQRELESIDARAYDTKFPLLKGRILVPKVLDVGEFDNEYTYSQYTTSGKSKIIADNADDLPVVNATGAQFTSRMKTCGAKYRYSIMEIKAAAAKGKPLNDLLARAARQAVEEQIDELIAFGSTLHAITGFINNADVDDSTFVPVPKTGADTWLDAGAPHATGAEMVTDVNKLVAQVWGQLKEAQGLGSGKLMVVLPATEYAYLAATPVGDNADKTALKFLLDNNPFLEGIEPWHKLSGAGAGSANRMICYMRDPMVLGALIPQEYTPQAPQLWGLNYEVPVTARCGGSVIRYPVAMAYGDGI